jgi:hypothetical protein
MMFLCKWKGKETCLDGKDVVGLVLLSSHQKAELSHTFGTTTRNGLGLGNLTTTSAVAVLLVELLLAALTLALQALDDINGTTDMSIVIVGHPVSGVLSLVTHSATTGQGLGLGETGAASKVEVDLAAARRSKGGGDRLAHGSGWLRSARGLTVEERLRRSGSCLGRRRVKTLGRWGAESLGRGMLALASATRAVAVLVQVFHLTEELIGVTFVVDGVEDLAIVLLFRLGSWEARVNVLRDDTKLLVSASCEAWEVRFFERTVFIQSTADKVSAVGEIRGLLGVSDVLGTALDSLTVDGSDWWIGLHLMEGRSTHHSGTWSNVNHRLSTRSPKAHVIVLIIIIRIGESSLLVGVVTVRIIVLIVFVFIVILVEVNIEFVLILIFLLIVILIGIGILLIKLLFFLGLLLCLGSQPSDVVFLGQGVVDGQLDTNSIAIPSNPIILTGDTTGKLVELRAIRSEVRRVGPEELGARHGLTARGNLSRGSRQGGSSLGSGWGGLGSSVLAASVILRVAGRSVLSWRRSRWACKLDTRLARSFLGRRGLNHGLGARWLRWGLSWGSRLAAACKLNASLLGLLGLSLLQFHSSSKKGSMSWLGSALMVKTKHGHFGERRARCAWSRRAGEASITGKVGGRGEANVADERAASLSGVGGVLRSVQVVIRVSIDRLGQQGGLLGGRSNGSSLEIVGSKLLLFEV